MKNKMTGIRPVLVIAGLALALGSLAGCPARWTPCECDDTPYTLSLVNFPGGYGTISKSPDKTNYKKGDYVALTFTPNDSGRFLMWICSPPSHLAGGSNLASGSKEPSVGLYITDDSTHYHETMAAAWSGPKTQTLYVDWDKDHGHVEMPSNGQGGSGTLTASVNYGETITLNAVPSSGYYTVWHGQWYNNFWSGERYGNTVTVKMLGSTRLVASFRPNSGYPPSMNYVSVNASGGADVFCSGATTASFSSGTYPATTAYGPDKFSFYVQPQKGYAFNYMTWVADNQRWYSTGNVFGYYSSGSYSAYLSKTIKLDIKTEGQGVVTSPDFLSEWNPKPYSPLGEGNSLTPQPNWNQVTMKADPCLGWVLDYWEYKNAQGETVTATGNYLNVYMNWWPGNGVRVPDGASTFNVKAVFVKCPLDILEPNGDPVTDNHYVYDTSAQGICNVTPVASGCECSGWDWNLESIGGAIFSTVPDPPNSPTPILRYTGLPSANNQFGDKILVVRRLDGTDPVSTTVQIFFSRDEWNHPPLSPAEQATMIGAETTTGNVPNWFYYWRQTTAAYGLHRYTSGTSRVYWNTTVTPPRWEAYVGNDACQSEFDIKLGPEIAPDYIWNSSGIDTYAWKTRHEASHLKDFPTWWPNGLINVLQRSPDNDGIPNEFEASLGFDYNLGMADTNDDGERDCDDYAIRTQQYWEYYSAQEEDWSYPGQQSTL